MTPMREMYKIYIYSIVCLEIEGFWGVSQWKHFIFKYIETFIKCIISIVFLLAL